MATPVPVLEDYRYVKERSVDAPTVVDSAFVSEEVDVAGTSVERHNVEAPMPSASEAQVSVASTSEDKFIKLFARLKSLQRLEDDWNSYGAAAPNRKALYWGHSVLAALFRVNLVPAAISASSDDGVGITFRESNRRAAIECLNSGEVLAVISNGTFGPYVWNVPTDPMEIKRAVEEIKSFLTV